MKTSLVIVTVAVICSATLLAATGSIAGDQVLDLLKTLIVGGLGGGIAATVVKR